MKTLILEGVKEFYAPRTLPTPNHMFGLTANIINQDLYLAKAYAENTIKIEKFFFEDLVFLEKIYETVRVDNDTVCFVNIPRIQVYAAGKGSNPMTAKINALKTVLSIVTTVQSSYHIPDARVKTVPSEDYKDFVIKVKESVQNPEMYSSDEEESDSDDGPTMKVFSQGDDSIIESKEVDQVVEKFQMTNVEDLGKEETVDHVEISMEEVNVEVELKVDDKYVDVLNKICEVFSKKFFFEVKCGECETLFSGGAEVFKTPYVYCDVCDRSIALFGAAVNTEIQSFGQLLLANIVMTTFSEKFGYFVPNSWDLVGTIVSSADFIERFAVDFGQGYERFFDPDILTLLVYTGVVFDSEFRNKLVLFLDDFFGIVHSNFRVSREWFKIDYGDDHLFGNELIKPFTVISRGMHKFYGSYTEEELDAMVGYVGVLITRGFDKDNKLFNTKRVMESCLLIMRGNTVVT